MTNINLQTKINTQTLSTKIYDLEERTLEFSKEALQVLKKAPQNLINSPLLSQVVRSITSIGANYIEANEALGKKDFLLRVRISRKEAKESCYWLKLIISVNNDWGSLKELECLLDESSQLLKILSRIIEKSK